MKQLLLLGIVMAIISAEVISFDKGVIDKVFKDKQTTVFLFTTTGKESDDALAAFNQLDETHPEGVLLVHSSSEDGHGLYNRLAEYIGIDLATVPTVVFLGAGGDKYVLEDEYTVDKLKEFISKAESKEFEPFLKSHPIPEEND
jgi:hypothetical protein